MRRNRKLAQAQQILMIHANLRKPPKLTAAQTYKCAAAFGYYWNTARKEWQNVRLTLTHIQSSAALFGKPDSMTQDYLKRLVDGKILRIRGGQYVRTKKVDLAGDLGNFNYGR